jgi:metal-dependent amidase/aminoacylase/carboxypeptidase family protein
MLGAIRGGTSYNNTAALASLRFEIRSESEELVLEIGRRIQEITEEISYQTKSSVRLNVIARRKPGGIAFGHPMARCGRDILKALEITPRISPSTSELSALIDASIPAVTVGISEGENLNEENETVQIAPISTGIAQLIGLILAADGGFCNES